MLMEDGCLSHRSVSANHPRKQVEAWLIGKHYGSAFLQRPLSERAPRVNASVVCMLTSDVPLADRVRLHTVLEGRRRPVMVRASEALHGRPALSRCSVYALLLRAGYMMIDGVLSSYTRMRPLVLFNAAIFGGKPPKMAAGLFREPAAPR